MRHKRKIEAWATAMLLGVLVGGLILVVVRYYLPPQTLSLSGVVLTESSDPNKQVPIANATVTAMIGRFNTTVQSNSEGLFQVHLQPKFTTDRTVRFTFNHSGYEPLSITTAANAQILVARMLPLPTEEQTVATRPQMITKSSVRVRYTTKATITTDVGSLVKTFEIANEGNVRCGESLPCSPDGLWKASRGEASYDAGEGNQLRNVRLSCIGGPCPFSSVESQRLSEDGRILNLTILNWSDTVTYLLEAEVSRTRIADVVRESYPALFGKTMTFTLPAGAEGPSVEAELNGLEMVFPLGPELLVSWLACEAEQRSHETRLFRCELKEGYEFR